MIEFNSSHILAGQIKQLLSTFNLPTYRIYTQENKDYLKEYGVEKDIIPTVKCQAKYQFDEHMQYAPYIKDGSIQYYIFDESNEVEKLHWESTTQQYAYNIHIQNYTKNLKINNNIYDTYTHEYLGDYLRFKRDYEGIDLMSLYNCFSNKICNKLDYTINTNTTILEENKKIKFNTANENYKIYMLPVKLFKKYTIAIDCSTPVEICCGIYGKYQDSREKSLAIPTLTYKKYSHIIFNQPVIYTPLTEIGTLLSKKSLSDIATSEQDLKMFIKIPTTNESSIVVLEGDYRRYNDSILRFVNIDDKVNQLQRTQNYTVTNFDTTVNDFLQFKPVTALQLLRTNTKKSYPFADRLIEYLLGNVIDSNEEILDNIKRVQSVIELNNKYAEVVAETTIDEETQQDITKYKKYYLIDSLIPKNYGVWDASIRPILYDKFNTTLTRKANNNDTNHDILGYVDKDIEKWYSANMIAAPVKESSETEEEYQKRLQKYKEYEAERITISGIDLYTTKDGLYSNDAEENK